MLVISILAVPSFAFSPAIRDIDITVSLNEDGSARVTEVWDVTVASGTEWYLVVGNLGDMRIKDLSVTDETGLHFINEGDWDVDRTITQKTGKCGLVRKSDGYEICWGVGSYGDHVYTVSYTKTNLVKSLNDYDAFNHQFITTGLSSRPEHARVTISKEGAVFDTTQVRIASFGYVGTIHFIDGKIVAESSEPFRSNSSMIVMARFDKGIFAPVSVENRDFSDMEEKAVAGSDYEQKENSSKSGISGILSGIAQSLYNIILVLIPFGLLGATAITKSKGAARKGVFGFKPTADNIQWCRELPYNGNIYATYYTLTKAQMLPQKNVIASALVLRMLLEGDISISKDNKDKTLISFNDKPIDDTLQVRLYAMIKEASGSDQILQNNEFSAWAKRNYKKVQEWVKAVDAEGVAALANCDAQYKVTNLFEYNKFNEQGQEMARRMLGFKKYLEDFTIINERKAVEVSLWREYMIFATLFGIAEKVAKDLKAIDAVSFESIMQMGNNNFGGSLTLMDIMRLSNAMSRSVTTGAEYAVPKSTSSSWGGGGFSSFGGGGGFSGGGFGGGSR